ncbi:MAG: hypothetical protein U0930_24510 [Pirellulales bacterium]
MARSTTSTTYSLRTTVALDGGATNVNTNQQTGLGPVSLVANSLKEIDASAVLGSLTATSGKVGLHFEALNQAAMQVVGLRLVYAAPEATISHDSTLTGNGSSSSPLSVATAPFLTDAAHTALADQATNAQNLNGLPASNYLTVANGDTRYVQSVSAGANLVQVGTPQNPVLAVDTVPFSKLTGVPSGLADGDDVGLPLTGGSISGDLAVAGNITGSNITGSNISGNNFVAGGSIVAIGSLASQGTVKVGAFASAPTALRRNVSKGNDILQLGQ